MGWNAKHHHTGSGGGLVHEEILGEQVVAFSTSPDDLARELWLLKDQVNRSQSIQSGWVGSGTEPYFNYLRARDGFFDRPIMEAARVRRIGSTQNIPNDTWTAINFDEITFNTGLVEVSTTINSSIVRISVAAQANTQKGVWFNGLIGWLGSTVGIRAVQINLYDESDVSLGVVPLGYTRVSSVGSSAQHVNAFSVPFRFSSAGRYITLEAYQNTGTTLDIDQCYLGAVRTF